MPLRDEHVNQGVATALDVCHHNRTPCSLLFVSYSVVVLCAVSQKVFLRMNPNRLSDFILRSVPESHILIKKNGAPSPAEADPLAAGIFQFDLLCADQ